MILAARAGVSMPRDASRASPSSNGRTIRTFGMASSGAIRRVVVTRLFRRSVTSQPAWAKTSTTATAQIAEPSIRLRLTSP